MFYDQAEALTFVDLSHPYSFDRIEYDHVVSREISLDSASSSDEDEDEPAPKEPKGLLPNDNTTVKLPKTNLNTLDDEIVDTMKGRRFDDKRHRVGGYVGAYSREARKARVELFLRKRAKRVWTKKVKYGVRKNFADSRMRVKGRFVKKDDEDLLRDLVNII